MPLQLESGGVGDLIFGLRQEKGWSLREAAARIGISHSRLDEIEKGVDNHSGKRIQPSYASLTKIASAYGAPAENLLRMAGYKPDLVLDPSEKVLVVGYRSLPPDMRERLVVELDRLVAENQAGLVAQPAGLHAPRPLALAGGQCSRVNPYFRNIPIIAVFELARPMESAPLAGVGIDTCLVEPVPAQDLQSALFSLLADRGRLVQILPRTSSDVALNAVGLSRPATVFVRSIAEAAREQVLTRRPPGLPRLKSFAGRYMMLSISRDLKMD